MGSWKDLGEGATLHNNLDLHQRIAVHMSLDGKSGFQDLVPTLWLKMSQFHCWEVLTLNLFAFSFEAMALPPTKSFQEALVFIDWVNFNGATRLTIEWPNILQYFLAPMIRISGQLDTHLTRSACAKIKCKPFPLIEKVSFMMSTGFLDDNHLICPRVAVKAGRDGFFLRL
jgi:hypothetical protein